MKFALQALFQTFFLEVSRAGISVRTRRTFCGRLYTKNSVPPKNGARVLRWCNGGAVLAQCSAAQEQRDDAAQARRR